MKLAVATICPHVQERGVWYSYGPFVEELNRWHNLFEHLIMVAPVDQGEIPDGWSPYAKSDQIEVVAYRKNRGHGLAQPRTSLFEIPVMLNALQRACRRSDALHVRCPGSIGLLASAAGRLIARRRVAKFAGQWDGYPSEPRTVRWQRNLLRSNWWGAPTTVYAIGPQPKPHIIPFFSTAVTDAELAQASAIARQREGSLREPRVLFVGRLTAPKSADVILKAASILEPRRRPSRITFAGSGPELPRLESLSTTLGLNGVTAFLGAITREQVLKAYSEHDVLVLPSQTEGWPKALTEAMAFGLVCVATNTGIIPEMLADGRGFTVPFRDPERLATVLREIQESPSKAAKVGIRASEWASRYSLEQLEVQLRRILADSWGVDEDQLRAA